MNKIKDVVPPYACVPWFQENFQVGDSVTFLYRGGLVAFYEVSGVITEIDVPHIQVDSSTAWFLMGDIQKITKLP